MNPEQHAVTYQKALIANTDLASAQVFTFALPEHQLALIICGKADNVFLSIKQSIQELENQIKEFSGPVPSLFSFLTQNIQRHLGYLSDFELLLAAWTDDVLYLQRNGSDPEALPRAYLLRQNRLEALPFAGNNQLISGYLKPDDRVLLSNHGLITFLQSTTNIDEALTLLTSTPRDNLQDVLSSLSLDQEHEPPVAILQLEVSAPLPSPTPSALNPRTYSPQRRFRRRLLIPKLSRNFSLLLIGLALLVILPIVVFRIFFSAKPSQPVTTPPAATASQSASLPANTHQITDWSTLISFDLIKDKFSPTHFSYDSGNLLMLDEAQKSLISFNLKQKNPTILAGEKQLADAKFISLNGDYAFSFAPTKGVVRINTRTQKDLVAAPKSPEWGSIVDLYAFGSNFYLLDAGKSTIWKYVATDAGYGDAQSYFDDGVVTAFSDARKLQIDSSVWIQKGINELLKYTSGHQDFYSFSDFPDSVQSVSSFFVSSDTENVYLLDNTASRMYVTTKQGKFLAQYLGDKFATAKDLFVDESTKTLYLIDDQKIYQIPLN